MIRVNPPPSVRRSHVPSTSRACQFNHKYLPPALFSVIFPFISLSVSALPSSLHSILSSPFKHHMAITHRGDSLARGRVSTLKEPTPLAIAHPPTAGSRAARLVPPEDRMELTWLASHEAILRKAYHIRPSVNLFFQEPGSMGIARGEVTLTEHMFMAGVRLSFSKIVREICAFLGVALSQIAPNYWRYVIASSILWRQVLGNDMDVAQFFSIYHPFTKDGVVELRVRKDPMFIYLDQRKYGNNKGWRQQVFRISREW